MRSLTESELRRALGATIGVATDELERHDLALATGLRPLLAELADGSGGLMREPPRDDRLRAR